MAHPDANWLTFGRWFDQAVAAFDLANAALKTLVAALVLAAGGRFQLLL